MGGASPIVRYKESVDLQPTDVYRTELQVSYGRAADHQASDCHRTDGDGPEGQCADGQGAEADDADRRCTPGGRAGGGGASASAPTPDRRTAAPTCRHELIIGHGEQVSGYFSAAGRG
ncbi:hypothetical protein GA0070607_0087 [Micromonospora coriariae]|uniref:Uncharacterized protein n=1 Tax=Micromonospora coriariae TaxID=285665 RepID=A0A1C4U3D4_9ACTN|nr:hypothetical protein GA0070607_0087 [Micromonospora coriariae]